MRHTIPAFAFELDADTLQTLELRFDDAVEALSILRDAPAAGRDAAAGTLLNLVNALRDTGREVPGPEGETIVGTASLAALSLAAARAAEGPGEFDGRLDDVETVLDIAREGLLR